MQNEYLDAVRAHYHFDEWKGVNRLNKEIELQDIVLPKGLVRGLEPSRVREVDPGDGTRLLRASWVDPEHPESLVLLDLRVCPSRDSAHEVLLETLANMQAPDIRRLEEKAPGDVAFALDETRAVAFARANLVVHVSNGGSALVAVDSIARTIDEWIVTQA